MAIKERELRERHQNKARKTLCSLIDECAIHNNKTALINFAKDGSLTISYKHLISQIRNKSQELKSRHIKSGSNIIFFANNSPAWIISALAVIYSGATVVPVDPQQSDEVFKHILKDSSASWIFTDKKGSKRLEKILSRFKTHPHILHLDKETYSNHSIGPIQTESLDTDTAILFYTSGTTGMPKGVPLSHRNILLQLNSIAKLNLLRKNDRVLLPLPLFHVYPLNLGVFAPLMLGLPIILPYSLNGHEIMRAINKGRVTVIVSVPRLLRSLYQSIETRFNKNRLVGRNVSITLRQH